MGNFAENLNLGNRFRPPLLWAFTSMNMMNKTYKERLEEEEEEKKKDQVA